MGVGQHVRGASSSTFIRVRLPVTIDSIDVAPRVFLGVRVVAQHKNERED
jgi:hypothetical protein